MGENEGMELEVIVGENIHTIHIEPEGGHYRVVVDGVAHVVDLRQPEPSVFSMLIEGKAYEAFISRNGSEITVSLSGQSYQSRLAESSQRNRDDAGRIESLHRNEIVAPMPGKVVSILVEEGARVEQGDGVIIVEAMKMENELKAPRSGQVAEIYVQPHELVATKQPLIRLN